MTRILAVETSSRLLSAALWDGGLVHGAAEEGDRIHAARLVPLVRDLLAEAGWPLHSLDLFAAGIGPGSFTGLRLGLAVVNAWAYALERPVLGVSSAEAIAHQALASTAQAEAGPPDRPSRVEIAIRSRPHELYTASYGLTGLGKLASVQDPAYESDDAWLARLTTPARSPMGLAGRAGNEPSDREPYQRELRSSDLPAALPGLAAGDAPAALPVLAAGDGLVNPELAAALAEAGWWLADPATWLPRAATVAELAAAQIGTLRPDSRLAEDAKTARPGWTTPLLPVYVRDPVAPDALPEHAP